MAFLRNVLEILVAFLLWQVATVMSIQGWAALAAVGSAIVPMLMPES